VASYNRFASISNIDWNPPRYKITRKLPFIPLESEIDALIACCGKKTSTILQLLKETGMRIGEALRLKWIDVDLERKMITLNNPEKRGRPRAFKISEKLATMLNNLPKINDNLFGRTTVDVAGSNFYNQRKRAASKLGNPRLRRITFHTLRHWKATIEYQKTQDILHVMKLLGHRRIDNTLI
jgi:integrase